MPNRYLQAKKNNDYRWSRNIPRSSYIPWRKKGFMRSPTIRNGMRLGMMERLAKEVRERETKELMDKMQIGVSKPKRVRK